MKIKFNKKTFLNHLEKISKVLNSNSPLRALKGIFVSVSDTKITLIASNGVLSIKEIIESNSEIIILEIGKCLIPGKIFKEIIKKQEQEIELEIKDKKIIISSQGTEANLNTLDIEEYPTINFDGFGKELIIDADKLRDIIRNVSFAAAEGDKRIILNGVNLKAFEGFLTTTATNSFRLAYEKIAIDSNVDFDITIISRNLKDFIPINAKGKIKISVNDSKIITQFEKTTIVSKLIDAIYPEIEKIIPKEFQNKLIIDVLELERLIEKVIVVSSDNSRFVKLTINKEILLIESKREEVGNIQVTSSNFDWDGEEFVIVFNAQFFKEAISKFKGKIEIKLNGNQKPIIIVGNSSPSLMQLILPRRKY